MSFECIVLEKKEGVATITLNRPRALNALSSQLIAELKTALADIKNDVALRVVILTGTGKAFSAGRDIKELDTAGAETPSVTGADVCKAIDGLDKPVIAAVNGYCYTGAFEIIQSCDMVIAAANATFADTHARYGLSHAWGGSQRLPRIVGMMRAKEIILTSEPISAEEAYRIGLVNKVVPGEKLGEAARELALKIIRNDAAAVSSIKATINQGIKLNLKDALELEAAEFKRRRGAGLPAESRRRLDTFLGK